MTPGIAANQQRLFLGFVAEVRPHVRRDSALPRRIKELFARHRAIGSRDRKLYRELIYTYLRFLPWIDPLLDVQPALAAKVTAWLAPELKPTSAYRSAHCSDWPATPMTLAEKSALLAKLVGPLEPSEVAGGACALQPIPAFAPTELLPAWFHDHCPEAFTPPHLDAINSRASVWVRLQSRDANLVLDEFRAQQWPFERPEDFPDAVCLPPNADVAGTDAYRRGFIEIQDLGSQLVLASAPVPAGGRWLDACAGAGGKTLQLARLLGDAGHVDATDIRPEILEELRERSRRARLDNIAIVRQPTGEYDGVLVDAPCSGSGTWRRQPHLKWYVKPESIAAFTRTQSEILTAQATRVKRGGLLVYATCSLSRYENRNVAETFVRTHPGFQPLPPAPHHGGTFDGVGTTLLPGTRNTDGFYVATFRRQPDA